MMELNEQLKEVLNSDTNMGTPEKIKYVLQREIRPIIESHGGGIDYVDFADGVLKVSLTGICNGCPGAAMTVRNMVEGVLQMYIPEVREVVRVSA